jgi:hypothetical protein
VFVDLTELEEDDVVAAVGFAVRIFALESELHLGAAVARFVENLRVRRSS